MKTLALVPLFLAVGCAAAPIAQTALEPWSFRVSLNDQLLAANVKYIAVDAGVRASFEVWGPEVYGGPIVKLKEWSFEAAGERKVYQLVLPTRKGEQFQVVEATWEQARASMPSLPE